MSFKKSDKKSKKSPRSPPGSGAGAVASGEGPGPRAKLLELFGQIEQQFELMHTENIARELSS